MGKSNMKKKRNYLYVFLHLPKTGGTTFSEQIKKHLKKNEFLDITHLRYGFEKVDLKNKKNLEKIKVILGHASYYGIHKLFPKKIPRYIVFFRDPAERIVSAYNFEMRTKKGKLMDFWDWYNLQSKNEVVHFMDLKYKGKEGTKANMPDSFSKLYSNLFTIKGISYFFQRIFKIYSDLFKSSDNHLKKKLENSKKLVDNCWKIGIISHLDDDLKILFKEIGVPTKWENSNVTEKSKTYFKLDEISRKKIYEDNKYDKELFYYAMARKERKSL